MNRQGDESITESSGNVFADLGLPDAAETLTKAELTRMISAIIRTRGLTHAQVAALMGVDEPELAALVEGQLGLFSVDRLLHFLLALDHDVDIVVRPKAQERPRTRVSTTLAV